jgi:hypothetical protein
MQTTRKIAVNTSYRHPAVIPYWHQFRAEQQPLNICMRTTDKPKAQAKAKNIDGERVLSGKIESVGLSLSLSAGNHPYRNIS